MEAVVESIQKDPNAFEKRLQGLQDLHREHRAMEQNLLARLDALEQKLVDDHQSDSTRAGTNDRAPIKSAARLPTDNGSAGVTLLCSRTTKALATEIHKSLVSSGHVWNAQQLDENKTTLTNPCGENSIRVSTSNTPPTSSAANMTMQDRMNRLEATLIGSTMLYSAWILWNRWTS